MPGQETPAHAGAMRLQVRGLTVRFGGLAALTDVDLDVADGQVVGLIGPNGAGKTTVFNAVCGLVRPTAGTVTVAGRPAPRSPSGLAPAGVARTLQGLGLFPGLTVLENVEVGALATRGGEHAGGPDGPGRAPRSGAARTADRRDDAAGRALRALADLDLADRAALPVGALPYPEQKRVALARALVAEPRLLLLDEPAGGLGAADIAELDATVRRVAATGCAVLLVEHHVDFVMGLCDRVVVLDFGRVIADGLPDAVRRDPAVTAAYLGIEVTAR
ncbi:ABC transporter ATP-binding protein [Cellulomonas cellasea]|uniref:Branched-chain amino acid transport system ATP-binding protein n=1 Tax=Cellulomonas cellasea TaxID=43670 RepID=A0A7W4UHI3_9CELL|nr:ABC transporter ATP-binding protein [Cellulomonas cellasea]MBB2924253.1 branched-chain amino acid transport system ATP-binding protein [Cellulomonas cellasea]